MGIAVRTNPSFHQISQCCGQFWGKKGERASLLWICNRSDLGVFSEMQFSFLPNIAYQELKGSQQTTNRKFCRATLKELSYLR